MTLQQTAGSDASPTSTASTGALNHPLIIIIASSNSINFLTPQNDTQHYFNTQDSVFPLSLRFIDTNLYGYPSPSFLCFLFLFHVCFVLSFHRILLSRCWIEIAPFQNTGIVAIGCNATGQLLSDRCNIFFVFAASIFFHQLLQYLSFTICRLPS